MTGFAGNHHVLAKKMMENTEENWLHSLECVTQEIVASHSFHFYTFKLHVKCLNLYSYWLSGAFDRHTRKLCAIGCNGTWTCYCNCV